MTRPIEARISLVALSLNLSRVRDFAPNSVIKADAFGSGMPAQTVTRLTLTRPDDWHLHLRDGAVLASVLPDTARRFARAIIMPNLKPPVTTTQQALAYRARILAALPASMSFEPLMTLHLTEAMQIGRAHV